MNNVIDGCTKAIALALCVSFLNVGCNKVETKQKTPAVGQNTVAKTVECAHAIVNANGYLVGGTVNGKWLSARQMASKLRGGEVYKIYGSKGFIGNTKGSAPDKNLFVDTKPDATGGLAVSGDWNAAPRNYKPITSRSIHVKAVESILKQNGMPKSPVRIFGDSGVVRVDIDGKGTMIDIISAVDMDPSSRTVGEYCAIVITHLENGKQLHRLVVGSFHNPGAKEDIPVYYSLNGLWDLDGDGILEIVVDCMRPALESYRTEIYKYNADGSVRLVAAVRPNWDF